MEKMKLNIEDLKVESFETTENSSESKGTAFGYADTGVQPCQWTISPTVYEATCQGQDTCYSTCYGQNAYTCDDNCYRTMNGGWGCDTAQTSLTWDCGPRCSQALNINK